MMRFIIPIILLGLGLAIFLVFASPVYQEIGLLRAQVATYNEALDNSLALEKERDVLIQKYNSIDPENLKRLEKLLPQNVDNIRLILEIGNIALPYGMVLRDVKYNTVTEKENNGSLGGEGIQSGRGPGGEGNSEYGVWDLEFTTMGSYANFLNFTRDLQSNLRIVDVSSIEFSSTDGEKLSTLPSASSSESYRYSFKIKTYWLRN